MENELREEVLRYDEDNNDNYGLGCFGYVMNRTFDKEEIAAMSDTELKNLERLADEMYDEVLEKERFDEYWEYMGT